MATVYQKWRHADLLVQRVLQARNDLQVLRDRINTYFNDEGSLSSQAKASRLAQIAEGSQGVSNVVTSIGLIVIFVETNMTAQQRSAMLATVRAMTDTPAAQILQDIYTGMKNLVAPLQAIRRPHMDLANTYQMTRDDVVGLPALINAIPYVEIGVGPV